MEPRGYLLSPMILQVGEDVPLYEALLSDIFPGVDHLSLGFRGLRFRGLGV